MNTVDIEDVLRRALCAHGGEHLYDLPGRRPVWFLPKRHTP